MAGADISQFQGLDPDSGQTLAQKAQAVLGRLADLDIPVIAAVNGLALGGGLELAMACDLIYAASDARFGQPEINLGLLPFVGGTQRLTRLVGKVVAKELCFTGRMLSAPEAKTLGLVAQVFPPDTLVDEVQHIARSLAQKPPVALAVIKQVIDRGADLPLSKACALEIEALAACLNSPDAAEGVRAFLEKRPPNFSRTLPGKTSSFSA
jgi:enoyl-CoA hydratase